MNNNEIRWKQRFHNFERAYFKLKDAVEVFKSLSDLEKEGLIQRFEYTFELSWKTLKDFLESKDINVKFPRDVIKKAFLYEIIEDGDIWLEMMEERNIIAHIYDEKKINNILDRIVKKYYVSIGQVYRYLKEQL